MSKRSRSSEAEEGRMWMNLNRSPARGGGGGGGMTSSEESESESGSGSGSSSDISSVCASCNGEVVVEEEVEEIITRSMVLVGCPGCFMYVMLTDKSSQCPKCKNNVFLDFFKQHPL